MADEFVAAAASERARLLAVIADAERRAEEARAVVGAHDVMLTMLVDTHRELVARTEDVEKEANSILEAAEREARAIVASAHGHDANSALADADIDLSDLGLIEPGPIEPDNLEPQPIEPEQSFALAAPVLATTNGNGRFEGPANDRYFDFLRGALEDDEPLGPLGGPVEGDWTR